MTTAIASPVMGPNVVVAHGWVASGEWPVFSAILQFWLKLIVRPETASGGASVREEFEDLLQQANHLTLSTLSKVHDWTEKVGMAANDAHQGDFEPEHSKQWDGQSGSWAFKWRSHLLEGGWAEVTVWGNRSIRIDWRAGCNRDSLNLADLGLQQLWEMVPETGRGSHPEDAM